MASGIHATARSGGRSAAMRPLALVVSAVALAFAVLLLISGGPGHSAGAQTTTTLFPQRAQVPGVTQTTLSTTTRPLPPGFTPTTPGFSATTGATTSPTLGSIVTTPALVTTTTSRFGSSLSTTTGAVTPARTGTASVAWFASGLAALVLGFQVSLFSRPRGAHAFGRRGRKGEFYVRSWRDLGWAPPRHTR